MLSVTLRTNLPSQCRYFMQYLVCVPNLIKKNQAKKKKNQSISQYLSIKNIPITLFNCRGKKKINYSKITLPRKWKQKGKQWLLSRRFYLNEKKNKFRIILNYLLGNWTKKKKGSIQIGDRLCTTERIAQRTRPTKLRKPLLRRWEIERAIDTSKSVYESLHAKRGVLAFFVSFR